MTADAAVGARDGDPPAFAVQSLGCRVNQYESRALAGALAGAELIRQQMCPFRERVIMPTEPARIGWR